MFLARLIRPSIFGLLAGMALVIAGAVIAQRLPSPLPQEIAALVDIRPGAGSGVHKGELID